MDAPSTASLAPNDTMRNGIATVKSEMTSVHPLQPMQATVRRRQTCPQPLAVHHTCTGSA